MLELKFDVKPDEFGAINGIELAAEFITYAVKMLAPYVNSCPACTDDLFGIVANQVLEGHHENVREGATYDRVWCVGSGDQEKISKAHIEALRPLVISMLTAEGNEHQH